MSSSGASQLPVCVLGIDTATRSGSVALVEVHDGGAPRALAEVAHEEELRHAETLLPALDTCLERAGLDLTAVDGIAVSIGPGSFTGLRVGLATAKGLALATDAWVVGVGTLGAYAYADAAREPETERILVCLDARKGEVYDGLFAVDRSAGVARVEPLLAEAVEPPVAAVDRVREALARAGDDGATLRVVGDGALRYPREIVQGLAEGRAGVLSSAPEGPSGRGVAVAELGAGRFRADGSDDMAHLAPRYLRASEAELKLREKRARAAESH